LFVSAIIPAYNEENTVADVIGTVKEAKEVDEVVVVSDGSRDNTAFISKRCGAKVVELPENRGKGAAIKAGLQACRGDILLLHDADLVGLKAQHIRDLLEPVVKNHADMSVGIFTKGRLSTDLAQKIAPQLSGQRAVKRSVLEGLSNLEITGYGVDFVLTRYAEKAKVRVCEVEMKDLTHVTKEEKLGFVKGFAQRMKMYWQIYRGIILAKR